MSRADITRDVTRDPLAKALGWVSLGLAAPPLAKADAFTRAIGIDDKAKQRTAAMVVGARELVAGAGLLATRSPAWLWARVGGDAMDLALLGRAIRPDGSGRRRTVVTTAAVAGITALDVYAAVTRSRAKGATELTATTTVTASQRETYDRWRDLSRLPTFMAHVDEVRVLGGGKTHWRVTAPFGRTVEWDAETVDDIPGERIAWRSIKGADVDNEGSVTFTAAPGGRGTEVRVSMRYDVPGGKLGEAVARYFGEDPHQQLDDDLRRFKQIVETGEVVRSDGAPWGKRARSEFPQRPARPMSREERAKEGLE
jgi:uncharacterized membrane protein